MKNAKVSSVYEGKVEEDEEEEAGRSRAARQEARARMRNFKRVYVRAPRPCRRGRKRATTTRSMAWSRRSVSLPGIVKEKEDEDQNQYINNNKGKVVQNHENFIIDGGGEREEYPGADAEAVVEVEVVADEEEKGKNKEVGEKVIIDVDEMKNNKSSGTDEAEAVVEVMVEAGGGGGMEEECKWASGWYDGIDDWPMEWSYEEEWLWMGRGLGLGFSNPQWEYVNGVGWVDKKGPEI